MASNDDVVLTDEQIADQLAHFKLLESQRTELLRRQHQQRVVGALREWLTDDLPDLLYHNEVKGKEKEEFWRFITGNVPAMEEYATSESAEHWGRYRELWDDLFKNQFKPFWEAYVERDKKAANRKVYAFSLTTPDSDASAAICEAAIKLFEQKSVPISEGECYLEYGSSGYLPHVHGWYETEHGGRVFTKVFKRVWPLWGEDRRHHTKFRGGYHELVKNPQAYNLYASAEQRLIVRKRKSEPLVYGQTHPSSSSPAAPQEEASAQDAQNPACDHNQHSSDSGELLSDVE